jgi:hypothetical protein
MVGYLAGRWRTTRVVGLALLMTLIVAGSAAAACTSAGRVEKFDLGDENARTKFLFKAQSSTSGTFLTHEGSGASGVGYFQPRLDSGPQRMVGAMTDAPGASFDFPLDAPLARDYWLNVSKPITGVLHWSSEASKSAGREAARIRVELWSGQQLVGGDEMYQTASQASAGGSVFNICFRPETHLLAAQSSLTARVRLYGGLSDFQMGTAGATGSFLEFAYFPTNPLEGGLYLDGGRLITAATGDEDEPAESDAAPWVLLLALSLPFSGAGLAARRWGPAPVLALLLGTLLLAGCLGGDAGTAEVDNAPKATVGKVDSTYSDRADLEDAGVGSISGLLRDGSRGKTPLAGAHVVLLGTSFAMQTNHTGTFKFEPLPPKAYTLRIDAKGFVSVERQVEVQAGKIVHLNVTMAPPEITTGRDDSFHPHDDWGPDTRKDIFSGRLQPITPGHNQADRYVFKPAGRWVCPNAFWCETLIPMPESAPVLPGTIRIEVKLSWDASGTNAAKELGLRVSPPGAAINDRQTFLPRAPNTPFNIAIFPDEADPGHQKFTSWLFHIQTYATANTGPTSSPLFVTGASVQVDIAIYKGVVPYEPAHQEFWNNRTEIELLKDVKKSSTCAIPVLGCGDYYPSVNFVFPLGKDFFVPPGAKELRGTLSWTNPGGAPASNPLVWGLAYKPGNMPPSAAEPFKTATMTSTGALSASFVIPLEPEQTDQFYQTTSNWLFSPDDYDFPAKYTNTGVSGTTWSLSLTVYR